LRADIFPRRDEGREEMRKIEVDEEVYQALLKHVISFEDTPNDVLRRLLGLDEVGKRQETEQTVITEGDYERPVEEMISCLDLKKVSISKTARVHDAIPQRDYRLPILEALLEKGGKATRREVSEIIERKMRDKFNKSDLQVLSDGQTKRWQKGVDWERLRMVKDGLLRSDSPKGVWEITEKGRKYLRDAQYEA